MADTINPAYWIEAIRTAMHTTDCTAKVAVLSNAADNLERYIANLLPPPVESVNPRAEKLLTKGVPFFVVKASEPYAWDVVRLIRAHEGANWNAEDQRWAEKTIGSPEPALLPPAGAEAVAQIRRRVALAIDHGEAHGWETARSELIGILASDYPAPASLEGGEVAKWIDHVASEWDGVPHDDGGIACGDVGKRIRTMFAKATAAWPLAASPTQPDAEKTEFGWLIENGKQAPDLRYRTIDETGCIAWTDDHMKALRFARRDDAEMFAREDEDAWRIVEHAWHAAQAQGDTAGANHG